MAALAGIPDALRKMGERSSKLSLVDNKGLGKPTILGDDDPETRFRRWINLVEDYTVSVFGENSEKLYNGLLSTTAQSRKEILILLLDPQQTRQTRLRRLRRKVGSCILPCAT